MVANQSQCLHTCQHTRRTHIQPLNRLDEAAEMASLEQTNAKLAFSGWRYKHYFKFIVVKGKNMHVMCTLYPGAKTLSTSVVSNSNLMKHLTTTHGSTKLVAKNTDTSTQMIARHPPAKKDMEQSRQSSKS